MSQNLSESHDRLDEKQFLIAVKRLADSLTFGGDSSPFLGAGLDYVQSRGYQPGDPIKLIDWRVTARTGKVHVKEFEATKQLPIYIILDTSASMCVSSIQMSKYAWAVQLATGLALVGLDRMSPVGIMACGDRDLHIRPTLSRNTILQWAHELRHYNMSEETNLAASLRELAPSLDRNSMVIVISDMHDPESVSALKLMGQQHDLMVLLMQDPSEKGAVGGGFFRGREAETSREFVAHGKKTWLDTEALLGDLKLSAVDTLLLETDQPFMGKLRNFLKHRATVSRSGL